MSNLIEKLNYLYETKLEIASALTNKGVETSEDGKFRDYTESINNIQTTKFGLDLDRLIGVVDEEGALKNASGLYFFDASGVKSLKKDLSYLFIYDRYLNNVTFPDLTTGLSGSFQSAFYGCTALSAVDFSKLTSCPSSMFYNSFCNCTNLVKADLSSVENIESKGLSCTFEGCSNLQTVNLGKTLTVKQQGMDGAFKGCTSLSDFDFGIFNTLGSNALSSAFQQTAIEVASFSGLTSISTTSLGTTQETYAFADANSLTEIHFPEALQSTVESMSGFSNKWGATNATIYFDL